MKLEAYLFGFISVFAFAISVIYGILSHGEPIGTAALVLSGGFCMIVGGFFWFVSRRIDPRPEDRKDADIAEGSGEIGFFSPGSYWPIGLAGSAAVGAFGLAFYYLWLILIAGVLVLINLSGLLFEYYAGQNAAQH